MPGLRCASALAVLVSLSSTLAAVPVQALPAAKGEPARIAVVVPLVVPLDAPPILGADELGRWTAPGGLLAERLDAVTGTDATLAVDPRIYASIRLLGSAAPTAASAWLDRLEDLPNDSFALGWADADAAGLAEIDRTDLAAPLGLRFALDPARFEPTRLPPAPAPSAPSAETTIAPTPVPTSGSSSPPLPSDEELLAFDHSLTAVWAADGAILTAEGGYRTAGADTGVGSVPEGTVFALSRAVTDDEPAITPILEELRGGYELVGLGGIPPGQVETAVDSERSSLLSQIAVAADAEVPVAGVAPDPGAFLAERRLELLTALAVGRIDDGTGSEEAFLASSLALAEAVRLVDGSDLLVLSNSTGLPVTISNALDVPATVVLSARPLRPLLRIQGVPLEVTVEPGSSRTVYLPAQAVTNGRVDVLLSLANPEGASLGPDRIVNVDLQAQWEAIGFAILVVLGVAFAAGLASNIVRRRKAARP